MRTLALLLVAVFTAACVDRSGCLTGLACVERYCVLKGDTVGVLGRLDSSHRVTECIWLVSDKTVCDSIAHAKPARAVCKVGDSVAVA